MDKQEINIAKSDSMVKPLLDKRYPSIIGLSLTLENTVYLFIKFLAALINLLLF